MLTNAGLDPVVRPASIIETLPFPMEPETATMYLAMRKASAVYDEIKSKADSLPKGTNRDWPPASDYTIIGADTVVVHEGRIIGKPRDKQDAYSILSRLRATSHHVITGCCVIKDGVRNCFYEDTEVWFKSYSAEELNDYLSTDEAYDKAGGYAIQGSFGKYIDRIDGDYNNVVGLPLDKVLEYL
ncbi:MAG: Maf family protein [Clostridia bacterium]|nr:Maf family protein [Clostridia bacterium]